MTKEVYYEFVTLFNIWLSITFSTFYFRPSPTEAKANEWQPIFEKPQEVVITDGWQTISEKPQEVSTTNEAEEAQEAVPDKFSQNEDPSLWAVPDKFSQNEDPSLWAVPDKFSQNEDPSL
ncbi:hypothetical protein [Streptococcus equi]|uniref:hypothetical protein n=1 Tax=Streptococcus equi TaxID=1336 RepID=UPI001E42BAC2|nr:hypothetical protein [Streptococcus equi]